MEKIVNAPPPGPENASRIIVLDALRGLTVILAMIDHVKVQFVSDVHTLVPLTRLSTPSFIILFGAMIEIAYLSKLRDGLNESVVQSRMLGRLVTCAGLATLLTLAAMISGNLTFDAGIHALLGQGLGRFNEILLIYTALFAILLLILPIMARFGSVPVVCLALIGWAVRAYLAPLYPDPPYILNFLLGIGTGYGPAVLPAMTFLAFGMVVGEMLTEHRGPAFALIIIAAAAFVCGTELSQGIMEAGRRFLANRWINAPGYYAVGIIAFVCMACVFMVAERIAALRSAFNTLGVIGTQSLFIYCAGNLALNLLPMTNLPHIIGFPVALGFLLGLTVLAIIGPQKRNTLGLGLPVIWGRIWGKFRRALVSKLMAIRRPAALGWHFYDGPRRSRAMRSKIAAPIGIRSSGKS